MLSVWTGLVEFIEKRYKFIGVGCMTGRVVLLDRSDVHRVIGVSVSVSRGGRWVDRVSMWWVGWVMVIV